jgi:hypothetical protein
MAEYDAYMFLPKADPAFTETFRKDGLPPGIRYAASVTGPWQGFAIASFGELAALPRIIAGIASDPPTALALQPRYLKKSSYDPVSAFVRIHIGEGGPKSVLEDVREAIRSHEAEIVLGDFDILAYVGAGDEDELIETILYRLHRVPGIGRTVTLHVIDYVTSNPAAGKQHVAKVRKK